MVVLVPIQFQTRIIQFNNTINNTIILHGNLVGIKIKIILITENIFFKSIVLLNSYQIIIINTIL